MSNINYREINSTNIAIGQKIRIMRKTMNMTQKELAEQIGTSFQQVQKYEKGINKVSLETLLTICKTLNCSLSYFVGDMEFGDSANDSNLSTRLKLAIDKIKSPEIKESILNLIENINKL